MHIYLCNCLTVYFCLIFQQSEIDSDSGDEDDESSANDVFGVTTVVNLTEKQVFNFIYNEIMV